MFRTPFAAALMLLAVGNPVHAASCDQHASQLASAEGGKVVSVRAVGSECEIKLLIPSSDGPPVRRTFMVSK